ncbi:type I-C CRISPR-associated protein Cas5 [Olsenella sp. KGMB02461]|nr:type I-C CRISPR-associated protein Cas5 [Olsenella sp. KGMB02461]
MGYGITILATGKRACFTRPEMKAERVSYDCITPSAARGLIEAVYWKPAIRWSIDEIGVLNEIAFESIMRNEVGSKLSYRNAKSAQSKDAPLSLIATEDRQQRATLMLSNVAYLIKAHFDLTPEAGPEDTVEKHYNIALRRLRKGQHFNQPYFGCREFPAAITLIEDRVPPTSFYHSIAEKDLGFMLYDIDFEHDMTPQFFRAVMRNGIIDVAKAREELIQ